MVKKEGKVRGFRAWIMWIYIALICEAMAVTHHIGAGGRTTFGIFAMLAFGLALVSMLVARQSAATITTVIGNGLLAWIFWGKLPGFQHSATPWALVYIAGVLTVLVLQGSNILSRLWDARHIVWQFFTNQPQTP